MSLDKKILEEVKRFNLMSGYSPKRTLTENLNEQATPGGVKQAAVDKILAISKNNYSRGRGSYLFSTQQSDIDKEFGQGTYDKFFNNGGQNILYNKKTEPKQEQKSTKPEIEIPSGVSQAAIDKILAISKNNYSRGRGSYLFSTQQSDIDKEFGQGTYSTFFNKGGKDVLMGDKTFKKSVGGSGNKQKPVPIPPELKDENGVRAFQTWLDTNKAGWATGFTGGKLNRAGGYGRFGPRTSRAWSSYGNEYIKSLSKTNSGTTQGDVAVSSTGGYATDFDNNGEPGKGQEV
jgi:hypothetical protein